MLQPLTFLAIHAHPDDESIGTGGTFARYASEGIRTALICCTRGEEGEIHDPDLDPAAATRRLGAIREVELCRAAAILGIDEVHLLPYRDSGMMGTAANDRADNFINADPVDAADRVSALIRMIRPQVVVTYDEGGGYGHPDHRMAHRITLRAIAQAAAGDDELSWQVLKLYYGATSLSTLLWVNAQMRARGLTPPFNLDNPAADIRQLTSPDAGITARVRVDTYLDTVRRALRAHRTQIAESDPLLALPRDIAAMAFGTECYIRAWSRLPAPAWEDDLFAGLRQHGNMASGPGASGMAPSHQPIRPPNTVT